MTEHGNNPKDMPATVPKGESPTDAVAAECELCGESHDDGACWDETDDDTLTAARSVTLLARLLQVVFGLAALGHWFMAETGTAALPVLAFVGRALLALGIVAVIEYVVVRRGGTDE